MKNERNTQNGPQRRSRVNPPTASVSAARLSHFHSSKEPDAGLPWQPEGEDARVLERQPCPAYVLVILLKSYDSYEDAVVVASNSSLVRHEAYSSVIYTV